jgi:dienelactone hydrolase
MGGDQSLIHDATRRIPIGIWIGSRDQYFPLDAVRTTRDELLQQGFSVQLTVMPGFDHNYYGHSSEVNDEAWRFLKGQSLISPPIWNPLSANTY